ncbi:MAG TPA: hypothetical protein VNX68_07870, partial [Nitrosopumilaceae archaeon]|nr:hypothetical protein [Nitrosopumilaceae archaeon]
GIGTHFNISPRFDIYLTTQYMIHLGNDIKADRKEGKVTFTKEPGVNLEGHILTTIGINYKIADLW